MEIQHNITYLLTAVPCTECTMYSVNSANAEDVQRIGLYET